MKKQKKLLIQLIIFFSVLLSSCQVFATSITDYLGEVKFSEEYLQYLELSDEEKENVIVPRMYEIPKTKVTVTNPLKIVRMLGSTISSEYSLRTVIPENMVIKNQQLTNSCWTFASLASLESNLALKNYKNGLIGENAIVYDFSERHMEYATSKTFLDNAINPIGFNREVGDGGVSYIYIPYLTNGTGAIAETEMPFENNEDSIYISEIQNKNVITQVNDIVTFPSYSSTDDKTEIIKQMKEHIKNYGGIEAGIHGASIDPNSKVYNYETGAIYCNNNDYIINHSVTIIGWDDNYSTENFVANNQPENNGAWIIKNSWGTEVEYTLPEMKEYVFIKFYNECAAKGWTDVTQITDDFAISKFESLGFTIDENNVATLKVGDNGFMYVSYEDYNIYSQLTGIIDAQDEIEYENIYQYDYYGGVLDLTIKMPKAYLASVFDKKTSGTEYLTQVSVMAPETCTYKVYVNPNGTSKSMEDLQEVELKAGETETFGAGYHTIEFLNPVQITGESFVVVLEIVGIQTDSVSVMIEFNYGEYFGDDGSVRSIYNNVTIESGKCFVTTEDGINANEWDDTSTLYSISEGSAPNCDTTIKAFTVSTILQSIEVTTPPTKTSYIEGEDFDATGMVVTANYINGNTEEITDYTISNRTNLTAGQTSVTISYEGKTTTQPIEVVENSVESISIKTAPTKTEYWAGEDFDATGMVIEATYKDGTTQEVTDYTIQNGQTSITISYEGKTVEQAITVKANTVIKIEIVTPPAKTAYVARQNFDKTGMVVKATYENGIVKEVTNYTVTDGNDLYEGQTTVTISYEGKTVTQAITVVAKDITSIKVKTMPTKTEYIQNKEDLDLTGGVIEISYNDETKEEMLMTSEQITVSGFNNQEVGTQTITLTYQGKTTQFDVEIKEEAKPENSNFDNVQANVTKIKGYFYTDINKEGHIVLDMELDNIIKATENDDMEYYYYLSTNSQETNITNWVKIDTIKEVGSKLSFEINTSDISNYEELVSANTIYLYVKEVAIRNNMTKEDITVALALDVEKVTIEEYIDGEKVADINSDTITDSTPGMDDDNTLASGTIPKAGKSVFIICLMFAFIIVGRMAYLKYKDIQIK